MGLVPVLEESERDGVFEVELDGRPLVPRAAGLLDRLVGRGGRLRDDEVLEELAARLATGRDCRT